MNSEKSFNIIYAENGEIGKTYMVILSPTSVYRVTIKAHGEMGVCVEDERCPGQQNYVISCKSPLVEFDEEFYNAARKSKGEEKKSINIPVNNIKQIKDKSGESKMARNTAPRSTIIDQELAKIPEGQEPVWNDILQAVIAAGRGTEADKSSIISQAKIRHKWYTVQGKVNPVLKAS